MTERATLFDVLGIGPEATDEEVEAAWGRHFAAADASYEHVPQEVRHAYSVLQAADQRRWYMQMLENAETEQPLTVGTDGDLETFKQSCERTLLRYIVDPQRSNVYHVRAPWQPDPDFARPAGNHSSGAVSRAAASRPDLASADQPQQFRIPWPCSDVPYRKTLRAFFYRRWFTARRSWRLPVYFLVGAVATTAAKFYTLGTIFTILIPVALAYAIVKYVLFRKFVGRTAADAGQLARSWRNQWLAAEKKTIQALSAAGPVDAMRALPTLPPLIFAEPTNAQTLKVPQAGAASWEDLRDRVFVACLKAFRSVAYEPAPVIGFHHFNGMKKLAAVYAVAPNLQQWFVIGHLPNGTLEDFIIDCYTVYWVRRCYLDNGERYDGDPELARGFLRAPVFVNTTDDRGYLRKPRLGERREMINGRYNPAFGDSIDAFLITLTRARRSQYMYAEPNALSNGQKRALEDTILTRLREALPARRPQIGS